MKEVLKAEGLDDDMPWEERHWKDHECVMDIIENQKHRSMNDLANAIAALVAMDYSKLEEALEAVNNIVASMLK